MALTIGELLQGRERPHSVRPDEPLKSAIEQMLRFDYTQLPVTTEADKLVGIITADSILRALDALGLPPERLAVADAMSRPRSFDPDADVSDLLNALRDQYAALVVGGDGKLLGIVTGYDASEYFRRRSEDIMLVEDIESSIKEHILAAFQQESGKTDHARLAEAIATVCDPSKQLRPTIYRAIRRYLELVGVEGKPNQDALEAAASQSCAPTKSIEFDDLTLSQYIDLLLRQQTWSAYADVFGIDADALRRLLSSVRDIRNALAHFRGEISATERERLRYSAAWLDRHPPRLISPPVPPATVTPPTTESVPDEIVPVDEEIEPGEGRYARLAVWLQKASSAQDAIELTFNQIEEILSGALPTSAREHRSWWANDSVSHPQSRRWLEVGWRVASLSLADETVIFARVEERESAYIAFFSRLTADLEKTSVPLRGSSPSGVSWYDIARLPAQGPLIGLLVCSFARRERIRVEFYIDAKDKEINKAVFDKCLAERGDIEEGFGSALSWERLDNRRACRIAAYRDGAITWDAAELERLLKWSADAAVRLYEVFNPVVSRVVAEVVGSRDA
jgi:CBS domain-containing protein